MANLITASDITARMGTQAYARLYAKDGGNTPTDAYVSVCIAEADSRVRTILQAAFPDGVDAAGGTVDVVIVGATVDICNGIAASRHPSADWAAGYLATRDRAEKILREFNRDADARLVTSAAGLAQPVARNQNITDRYGVPSNPLTRAADGTDRTGF